MNDGESKRNQGSRGRRTASELPLSALLSQVLVAFTIEFDNEFEQRMAESGFPGARLSLVLWSNLIRFIPRKGITVGDLTRKAIASQERIKHHLGCLERWGYVVLGPGPVEGRPAGKTSKQSARAERDGWGSGRGIRADWVVLLTSAGQQAAKLWTPLFGVIEERWATRFGKVQIDQLREALLAVVDNLDVELPQGLPGLWPSAETFPARVSRERAGLSLPALLSQSLLAFTIEFDRES
ncbi:MAG TPA: hypothetical protein VFG04_26920, partial [Planctomycetaceae bacterium]|nr:hypothetical protein [Planctomycetaceae bacterium]